MTKDIIVGLKWIDAPSWYSKAEITLRNTTSNDIESPKISFKIVNGAAINSASAHTGFEPATFNSPVDKIEGHLAGHLSTLKANSTTVLTFGFNMSSTDQDKFFSIKDFTFNDVPVAYDFFPPTLVKNITQIDKNPGSVSLKWDASEDLESKPGAGDNSGVEKYKVDYYLVDANHNQIGQIHHSETFEPHISLNLSDIRVEGHIRAVDLAGNEGPGMIFEAFIG